MTLDDLNAKDRSAFVGAVGAVFERSPWVAERAWEKRPFPTLGALVDAMESVVAAAPVEEQLSLLRAHPELGTGPGRVRLQPDEMPNAPDDMSPPSRREQARAGLDSLTREQSERLQMLNAAYRERFGFPFLYAVKGSTIDDILAALERRLPSARDAEHREALRQVYRIARFRLQEIIAEH